MEEGPYEHWIQARTGAAVARAREALDTYRFNEVAAEIHAFTWGELCDWYLELSKSTLYDESAPPARKNAVRHALFSTLSAVVRMLHPIMPCFAEDVWHRLPGTTGFVAMAPFPRVADYPHDETVLQEVSLLQEAITEVRRLRSEMELGRKVELRLLAADATIRERLSRHADALLDLCAARVEAMESRPAGSATVVVRGQELAVPLQGIVDIAAEIARLDKVLVKADKDASDLERRLSNPSFVDRAPAEVVAEVREKLANAVARRGALRAGRDRLAGAL
jgi:valyl-tRNA synthetase